MDMDDKIKTAELKGRYICNSFLTDYLLKLKKGFITTTFTSDPYDPADIIYTASNGAPLAVEVKVRTKSYPRFMYEVYKSKRLEEYKRQGYTIIYCNIVEDNNSIIFWNVTNINKMKGVIKDTSICPSTTCGYNPFLKEKECYYLPSSAAFLISDCSIYINRYKELTESAICQ